MIANALTVLFFTLLGLLAGWKLRGTWDEVSAAYALWSGGDNIEEGDHGR